MVASYAPGVRAFSDAPSEAPELASVGLAPASYAAPQPSHAERPAEVGYSDPSPAWTQDAPQQAAPPRHRMTGLRTSKAREGTWKARAFSTAAAVVHGLQRRPERARV